MRSSNRQKKQISMTLVVPVLNEACSIAPFLDRIDQVLTNLSNVTVDVLFVNDGSTDDTRAQVASQTGRDFGLKIINLSRNFGKEAAMTAGLEHATGDVVIPIDVDLQDPPDLIPEMLEKWREGYDVVLGRRVSRRDDSWVKRNSAKIYYLTHNKIAERPIPVNVGDFRLMDRCVVDALKELPESRRFMKGLFEWLGFSTTSVDYERLARHSGATKFNSRRLLSFAAEGITSFSIEPLRFWILIGFAISALAFCFGFFIVLRTLIVGADVPGFATIAAMIAFLGGMQLVGIGVLGEYLGRTYIESKRRPVYIIRDIENVGDN